MGVLKALISVYWRRYIWSSVAYLLWVSALFVNSYYVLRELIEYAGSLAANPNRSKTKVSTLTIYISIHIAGFGRISFSRLITMIIIDAHTRMHSHKYSHGVNKTHERSKSTQTVALARTHRLCRILC